MSQNSTAQAGFTSNLRFRSLIPNPPPFPFLLPALPRPYPTPLPKGGRIKLTSRRNLEQEANDLSDEEGEVDDSLLYVRNRGASFLIPLGRRHTLIEERNDAQGSSSESSNAGGDADDASDNGSDDDADDDPDEAANMDSMMDDLDAAEDEDEDEDGEDSEDEDDGEQEEGEEDDEDEDEDEGNSALMPNGHYGSDGIEMSF